MAQALPFQVNADYVRLSVKLTPNAGRDGIDGPETGADGETMLKARVTAVPEKGKANKALIELLAKSLKLPKSSISVISGDTARKKILRIDGDTEDIERKLVSLLKS
ncbi:DUF167 domain-containing protein [Rhizobium sp. C4]|uniref:DUF167 domain-containing protein n=1 Tax=Rhizobium sp. C4 TaxID=1349800 RepID=UPI001E461D4F|nr:DUF167 domain-containing protein [Rhizobium sp. C4]MCD2175490.1 DUF167 domain-containing protein [Rhizobium sp. C4]